MNRVKRTIASIYRRAPGDGAAGHAAEDFDADLPMARVIRDVMPPRAEIGAEARDRLVERVLASRRESVQAVREPRRRLVFAVASAALVLFAVVFTVVLVMMPRPAEKKEQLALSAVLRAKKGVVEVQSGSHWRRLRKGEQLEAGSTLRTQRGATASVRFPDGSTMRMTDLSRVKLAGIGRHSVAVEHLSGGTYHRAAGGSDYVVSNSDVATRAHGAVFNVENRVEGNLEIISLDKAVAVEIGRHRPIQVQQGEVMVVAMSEQKTADKEAVSRERLEERRLYSSARQDAKAGFSTGVYEQSGVPLTSAGPPAPVPAPAGPVTVSLSGDGTEAGSTLNWVVSGDGRYGSLVLLRSVGAQPQYPGDEIARYSDTSITSATDNSVIQSETYQYRLAAVQDGDVVSYSNTVLVTIPGSQARPGAATIFLVAEPGKGGVVLEWSVTGASTFGGYLVERTVTDAPADSKTPEGTTVSEQVDTTDVFYSYTDTRAMPGHTYRYRVGLVLDGSVMVYSEPRTVKVPDTK